MIISFYNLMIPQGDKRLHYFADYNYHVNRKPVGIVMVNGCCVR